MLQTNTRIREDLKIRMEHWLVDHREESITSLVNDALEVHMAKLEKRSPKNGRAA